MTTETNQPTKSEELAGVISSIHDAIPELFGVMIASIDGLAVAHDLSEGDAERIAAMAATALGLGSRISERTNLGALAETVVRGAKGHLVVYATGSDAILVLTGPLDSNLTLMRLEARVASVQINALLGRH
jgi:predicted regulator of Ras-like GTPase activity (Roadblock/LC7/MglB family)